MLIRLLLLAALNSLILPAFCQFTDRYTLIPRPAQLEPRSGEFIVDQHTEIRVSFSQPAIKAIADQFAGQLTRSSGLVISVNESNQPLSPSPAADQTLILFRPSLDTTLGGEGYRIDVTSQLVTIEASQANGFFYAVQTLLQLLPPSVLNETHSMFNSGLVRLPIPACRIQDQPRYAYQGHESGREPPFLFGSFY